ncbi:SMP-30/gluconolactonase/LRE family protein [Nakamurella sp.]|uniref:SMP-30/gluconolactonase/LRE family protein n=1 Tax=Nakamurella sp. TaxID=1869182 RepID=UPI003B39FBAC
MSRTGSGRAGRRGGAWRAVVVGLAVGCAGVAAAPVAAADHGPGGASRPATYQLPGQPAGSTFEGIGLDARRGVFYVSEVTGGEISRGRVDTPLARAWLGGNDTDGRITARGITVDRQGRVYIAGGPNRTSDPARPDRPDLWVYSSEGRLLAALQVPAGGAFLNDVTIGPDGAAYFTDSSPTPRIFRVAQDRSGWSVTLWRDATATIPTQAGFNLNGIVATPDGRALLAVQSVTGRLWRFDLRSDRIDPVPVTGGADLTGGDGLVRHGATLYVVRNFPRQLVTLRLTDGFARATLVSAVATDADRVFTTAAYDRGRLLAVDSRFDDGPAAVPPYEVVALPVR